LAGRRRFPRRDRRPGAALAEDRAGRGLSGRPCPGDPGPGQVATLGPRRRAASPDRAGGWTCPDQPLWAGPGSRVLAGRRPPQRQRQTAPPRGQAPWGRCRRGRARRRAGRAGWRWPGRSGARATSRSRRRCRAGDPRREARFPLGCVQGPPGRVPAAVNWTRRRPAPVPRTRPVGRFPALWRRVGRPARQGLTAPRLRFASPDPRRPEPAPRPTPIPDPLRQWHPVPWSPGAAPPFPSAPEHRPPGRWPGPARRWSRWPAWGRW